jgi:hypothetical protein
VNDGAASHPASDGATSHPVVDGAASHPASDSGPDAMLTCPGVSCAISLGPIYVNLTDSAGNPVPQPLFFFQNIPYAGTCLALVDGGAVDVDASALLGQPTQPSDAGDAAAPAVPSDCVKWAVRAPYVDTGPHTLVVSAPGYETTKFGFTFTRTCDNVCEEPAVTLDVLLNAGPTCGGNTCASDETCVVPCCAAPPCMSEEPPYCANSSVAACSPPGPTANGIETCQCQ